MNMIEQTCCFIGHRKIENKANLFEQLKLCVQDLIIKSNINTFLFGSRSEFTDLGLNVVSELKDSYPHIKRVYIRAEYERISNDYENYLLTFYEKTYVQNQIMGRALLESMMIMNGRCIVSYIDRKTMEFLNKMTFYNPEADYMRGFIYARGLGVPEDIKKGVEYLQKAGNFDKAKEELLHYKKTLFGKWVRR